jgi:hemerythrin-like domain-containing protein
MDETLQLIDQLIAEHKVISEKTRSLEKTANDASLLSNLKQAGDTFVRGDISQGEDLKKLEEMVIAINSWLDKHFSREETALLPAVKKYGDENLVNSLDSLLFEHSDLRDRMLHSRKRVDELLGGSLDQVRRDAAVRDLRVHLNHSRKLLETHAAKENHFLTELRRHLKKAARRKELP